MRGRRLDPSSLSVTMIRERSISGELRATRSVIDALEADPRAGARAIGHALRRRAEAAQVESRRLTRLIRYERELWNEGITSIAGVDEVGMGPLAGPVVAAAVVLPKGTRLAHVDDSKALDEAARERIFAEILEIAAGVGVGVAEVDEIDRMNVYHAGLLAMRRAVEALPAPPEHVLVDARRIPGIAEPQTPIVKGDSRSLSIAAASIVAKVRRDRMMRELDRTHPGYGFAGHKGYGTAEHQDALRRLGPCPIHRLSYPAVRELANRPLANLPLFSSITDGRFDGG